MNTLFILKMNERCSCQYFSHLCTAAVCIIFIIFIGSVKTQLLQEFLPRPLSPYGDGLENAQIFQIPYKDPLSSMVVTFAANVTLGCNPTNVSIYFRHGGLPIVNIQNATYPNFTWVDQPYDYEMNFIGDGQKRKLSVSARDSYSVLYGAAVLLEEATRIQQQGLTKSCTTLIWGRVEKMIETNNTHTYSSERDLTDSSQPATIELMRKNYVQPLTAKWTTFDNAIDSNVSANVNFNVSLHPAASPIYFSLSISSPTDVGGTLQIELKLDKEQNTSIIFGCIMHNTLDCDRGFQFSANGSSVDDKQKAKVIVPYPQEGFWFLSLFGNCSESRFNNTSCDRNITTSVQISLSPCQEGACGPHGRCIQYFSAGLIYSTCVCSSGFAGWSCSDGTNALSQTILLASLLILTLSNLFFVPAIVLAFRRGFYPQCMMYTGTMLFSAFYHACDQQEYNFCLMPYSILQFGDFYLSYTSVWMTSLLIAKPKVTHSIGETIALFGTAGIALTVHYNATSLPAFIIPIVCSLLVIAISWIHHSYSNKKCYPELSYYLKNVLPCVVFALVGVICFAFLETEENYFYVHSIWHISIALAIVFVIPTKSDDESNSVTKL